MSDENRLLTAKLPLKIRVPTLPNFLISEDEKHFAIGLLDEETLREIGQQWTEALVEKAGRRRTEQEIAELPRS